MPDDNEPTGAIRLEPARLSGRAMVCTVDHLASGAGLRALAAGGSAADGAVAASAALAVTTQHMCGMGGDLWALVHDGNGPPAALNGSGRAGSGSDPDQLRAEGHEAMPFRGDVRSVPIPGCVDGWLALHERYGRLDLGQVLSPAIELAEQGFPPTPMLQAAIPRIADVAGGDDFTRPSVDGLIRRPGLARSLRAIAEHGRSGWYEGEFGQRLIELGQGLYADHDLSRLSADWVEPVGVECWNHRLWTVPPNSQGYLSLLAASIAAGLNGLPQRSSDPGWAHLLIEAAKQAAVDRSDVLYENADVSNLFATDEVARRRQAVQLDRAGALSVPAAGGGTIHLCVVDEQRMGVSLMQSNAAGFGAHIAVPGVGVFLHNRGIGFSLSPDHPAELQPGKRPPSTLSPALVSGLDDGLDLVLGTMGGDGQPQVILQLLARILHGGEPIDEALSAPRFTLTVPDAVGFDTWAKADNIEVAVEAGSGWESELRRRGHRVDGRRWGEGLFGHAHIIEVRDSHLAGVAEPRALASAAVGL